MTDNNNDFNNNRSNENLPEWLAQFKRELAGAEKKSKDATENSQRGTTYSNTNFQSAESILMSPNGTNAVVASDYHPMALTKLSGYEDSIKKLKMLGLNQNEQSEKTGIINALNKFHGISARPALKPIILVGESADEIGPLLEATAQELSCATIKMSIQDTPTGFPAIAALANKTALSVSKGKPPLLWLSENDGLLVLENVEDWSVFFEDSSLEFGDGVQSFISIRLSPAGREFISLIEKCVENPNVQIICSTTSIDDIPSRLLEVLGEYSKVNIEKPNERERKNIWTNLANTHPSLRGFNFDELSSLTENLTRKDIEKIAQEAIAESYNSGLSTGRCDNVKKENLFEKILLKQDKDSEQFKRIEDMLVSNFSHSFDFNQVISR